MRRRNSELCAPQVNTSLFRDHFSYEPFHVHPIVAKFGVCVHFSFFFFFFYLMIPRQERALEIFVLPNIVSVRIRLAAESHRAVAVEKLLKKRAARQPHPHARVYRPISVQQKLVKDLREKKNLYNITHTFSPKGKILGTKKLNEILFSGYRLNFSTLFLKNKVNFFFFFFFSSVISLRVFTLSLRCIFAVISGDKIK